ncbi:MAG TPA: double zinc ribbon domain-containing protein, partial [Opitutaceae bacterium]
MKDDTVLGRLVRGVTEVVFPLVCVHCRALVDEGTGFRHLCAKCVAQIEWVKAPHCTTCGHPFYGVMEGTRMCVKCDGLEPAYREGRTAAIFKGPLRALVIELK